MKKFVSGLRRNTINRDNSFCGIEFGSYQKYIGTTVNGKKVAQHIVTINGTYYADLKQLTENLGIKYTVDTKSKQIKLGEVSKKSLIEFSNINYYYDANNKLLGVGNGTLLGVDPGEIMPFQFITEGKYKTVGSVKIRVEQLI